MNGTMTYGVVLSSQGRTGGCVVADTGVVDKSPDDYSSTSRAYVTRAHVTPRRSASLSFSLPLSLRIEGPHVLSVTALWVFVLWEGSGAFWSAMPDFMGTRLVPQCNVPWYTIDRMRLCQTMERTARKQGPADVQGGVGRARIGMPLIQ